MIYQLHWFFPMEHKPYVVFGEAPESDSEEEVNVSIFKTTQIKQPVQNNPQGIIVAGEAPESDEEHEDGERNISLHKNVYDFAHQTIVAAGRDLNTMNQQLLRSQIQLQEAATAVRVLQTHVMQLQTKLAAVTSTAFLPHINAPLNSDACQAVKSEVKIPRLGQLKYYNSILITVDNKKSEILICLLAVYLVEHHYIPVII
ncbi:biogenesis of lysosome-related organelles complex 1 subunit 3 isoform X6 [Periplaneta americana]|uniref:biogenesis of lysosome-related organelles complex 1 subunit 3 isoform X6 n=1 Tax=Periplaneta americana TaxID=6978 RepID=UPI0037E8A593